ncbi:hypothetical protein M2105_000598 [Paenibacillus sp. PastF-1]|nr:hypothetical protein [Paenibacillus sp. PastF-2]MDF9846184.1 hypothetical protein [Paenibacillus sp. PastM-2]MDF9852756.1 hypothetical protein [Paenibacillus sp. PastF-1]MDH6477513.1 hypothetical protein [Paenibacillus sp. PastH-2]
MAGVFYDIFNSIFDVWLSFDEFISESTVLLNTIFIGGAIRVARIIVIIKVVKYSGRSNSECIPVAAMINATSPLDTIPEPLAIEERALNLVDLAPPAPVPKKLVRTASRTTTSTSSTTAAPNMVVASLESSRFIYTCTVILTEVTLNNTPGTTNELRIIRTPPLLQIRQLKVT